MYIHVHACACIATTHNRIVRVHMHIRKYVGKYSVHACTCTYVYVDACTTNLEDIRTWIASALSSWLGRKGGRDLLLWGRGAAIPEGMNYIHVPLHVISVIIMHNMIAIGVRFS